MLLNCLQGYWHFSNEFAEGCFWQPSDKFDEGNENFFKIIYIYWGGGVPTPCDCDHVLESIEHCGVITRLFDNLRIH